MRVEINVPEPLASLLGFLASGGKKVTPAAPSSDVRNRLGTISTPQRKSLESKLGRPNNKDRRALLGPRAWVTYPQESQLLQWVPLLTLRQWMGLVRPASYCGTDRTPVYGGNRKLTCQQS